jgi:hypothetical protein
MATRISRLLSRNAEVSVEFGQLVVHQPNGEHVPQDWLQKYSLVLLHEILTALKIDAYEYYSYTTGNYDKRKFPGISLQFRSTVEEENTYVIFNVTLTRSRTTKAGAKGSPLPEGHFIVGKGSHFYKFWKSTALAAPKSLTSFHDYMGNLKGILFTANLTEGRDDGRINAGSIRPLSIPSDLVRKAFLPDNSRITSGYAPDNCHITKPDKDLAPAHTERAFQPRSTTCDQRYGRTVISEHDETGPNSLLPRPKRPQDQTVDEWTNKL